jgi:hypothetical protein
MEMTRFVSSSIVSNMLLFEEAMRPLVKTYLSSNLYRTSIDERVVRATSRLGGRRAFGSPTRVLYCFSGEALLLDRPPLYRKQRSFAVVDFDLAFDTST